MAYKLYPNNFTLIEAITGMAITSINYIYNYSTNGKINANVNIIVNFFDIFIDNILTSMFYLIQGIYETDPKRICILREALYIFYKNIFCVKYIEGAGTNYGKILSDTINVVINLSKYEYNLEKCEIYNLTYCLIIKYNQYNLLNCEQISDCEKQELICLSNNIISSVYNYIKKNQNLLINCKPICVK